MRRIKVKTLVNGYDIIDHAIVILDDNNRYLDHFRADVYDGDIDEYSGAYACPGFINTHCHLELSHLKNKIVEKNGLVDFILSVQKFRNTSVEEIQDAIENAEAEMIKNGIVAVGDISNTNNSFHQKSKSNLYYHTFLEAFSFLPERADAAMQQMQSLKAEANEMNLRASITPHAPYSVSQKLFNNIADVGETLYSLHHLEAQAEIDFLENKQGDFLKLYDTFNINIDFFKENKNATAYWLNHFNVQKLILVHNTFMNEEAYALITQAIEESYFCLCANANLYIENRLPDIPSLIHKTKNICIGTDSLASNHSLDIAGEIKTIHQHFKEIPIEFLLQAATIKGAEALNLEGFGVFSKGSVVNFMEI
ncbi:MAG: amidohydrolase family protein [bacterium]|jgi:cytosine/adenosine deaminase-related metal-dependent hydrolase